MQPEAIHTVQDFLWSCPDEDDSRTSSREASPPSISVFSLLLACHLGSLPFLLCLCSNRQRILSELQHHEEAVFFYLLFGTILQDDFGSGTIINIQ